MGPAEFDATSVRDETVKVLRSLRPIRADDVSEHVVTGQFGSGAVGGQPVKSYAEELGKESPTETFVSLKAHVENWRWAGVPFYLRTGKRMATRKTEIYIQFKCVPYSIFAERGGRGRSEQAGHLDPSRGEYPAAGRGPRRQGSTGEGIPCCARCRSMSGWPTPSPIAAPDRL